MSMSRLDQVLELADALQAQASFARFGQQDSEWRAWLLAARAAEQPSAAALSRAYATQADTVLAKLKQQWGAETYHSYLARLDLQHARQQLDQLLTPPTLKG